MGWCTSSGRIYTQRINSTYHNIKCDLKGYSVVQVGVSFVVVYRVSGFWENMLQSKPFVILN